MITEQQILDFMRETAYKPMTYGELEKHFDIENAEEFKQFLKMLNELEIKGLVLRTRNDRYGVPERMNLLRGRLQAHAKGFGFLIPEDRDLPDVYIHANDMNTAMNGDTILVRITSKGLSGGKTEGEVVRVVTRANTEIVGTFEHHESFGFVVPDDKRMNRDIFIPEDAFMGAVDGQKVVVRIVQYPEGRASAQGEVIEILGHKDDPGVDILSIIRKYNLPEAFNEEVTAEATGVPDTISEEEMKGRRDLRDKRIVTIDGEDAKDLDDAVNVEILPNGNYLLGVHIADVGYYVKEGSALDQEAYKRGCSVYLVDRVIPMLPRRLSNGICSLNPQVNRLTLSCEMEIDENAKVVRHDVFTSVIKTKERMTYSNVRKILTEPDEHPDLLERYGDLVDDFRLMEQLAMKLRNKRMNRGAIDFDFQEAKVLVDENGKPTDIIKRERSIAEMIIEEFMLAANETVAEHFYWLKVPFLYRIHEDPDPEKLLHFMQFIVNFGYVVKGKGNSIHPRELQKILEEIRDTKEAPVISTVMLRSMKQARYEAESLGHFGLAAQYYSHFTSPIRRYPDLVIHRVIREVLEQGMLSENRHNYLTEKMKDIAVQSSERERVAVDAERDTEALKKAEFMLDKIGEEFEGIISSVTSFGIFVELENTVEGLIRLSDLTDDYYHYNDMQHALIGERTSKIYRIGDDVKIRVARVNMDDHTIDFEMVDMKPRSSKKVSVFDKFGGGSRGRAAGTPAPGGKGKKKGKKNSAEPFSGKNGNGKKAKKTGELKRDEKPNKRKKRGVTLESEAVRSEDGRINDGRPENEAVRADDSQQSEGLEAGKKGIVKAKKAVKDKSGKNGKSKKDKSKNGKTKNGESKSEQFKSGKSSKDIESDVMASGEEKKQAKSQGKSRKKKDVTSSDDSLNISSSEKSSYTGDWASRVNVLSKGRRG